MAQQERFLSALRDFSPSLDHHGWNTGHPSGSGGVKGKVLTTWTWLRVKGPAQRLHPSPSPSPTVVKPPPSWWGEGGLNPEGHDPEDLITGQGMTFKFIGARQGQAEQ